jgi:hypothetical protein
MRRVVPIQAVRDSKRGGGRGRESLSRTFRSAPSDYDAIAEVKLVLVEKVTPVPLPFPAFEIDAQRLSARLSIVRRNALSAALVTAASGKASGSSPAAGGASVVRERASPTRVCLTASEHGLAWSDVPQPDRLVRNGLPAAAHRKCGTPPDTG